MDYAQAIIYDAAIVMFDLNSRTSYNSVRTYIKSLDSNKPIVVCGNKQDLPNKELRTRDIRSWKFSNYKDISARSAYNYEQPFLRVLQGLVAAGQIDFVAAPEEREIGIVMSSN